MKAIYINLDPYLQAFADWLNAGKPGDAPKFGPLPLTVTIPLGETAAIYLNNATQAADENAPDSATIDGKTVYFCVFPSGGAAMPEGNVLALEQVPGLSALAPSAKYAVVPWDAWETDNGTNVEFWIGEEQDESTGVHFVFRVIVNRETASGPVDLVDYTPPVSLSGVSFAGVDIEGAEFDGNEIVADESTGALSAPAGA